MRSQPLHSVSDTPADSQPLRDRDRVVDAVRAGCILVVVGGHWLMAGIGTEATGSGAYRLQIDNVLELRPWAQWLTWVLQVMPLFFIVGGFANLVSWQRSAEDGGRWADWMATRMRRLLTPALPMVLVWLVIVALAQTFLEPGLIEAGNRLVTTPLWFLGVYLVATAMTPMLVRLHARFGLGAPALWAAAAVAIDVTRFGRGDTPLAALNFVFVWVALTQLGMSWRLLVTHRRRWWVLTGAGYLALTLMVTVGPYNVSMVGVGGEVSNMAPPTVALLALGTAQLGLILGCWDRLGRLLAQPRHWASVTRVGAVGMTLYLWHLTAMAVAVCLVALSAAMGVAQPDPGSALWWATRPLWFGVLALILVPILRRAAPLEVRSLLAPTPDGVSTWAAALGVLAGVAALAYLAIEGLQPVTSATAAVAVLAGLMLALGPSGDDVPEAEAAPDGLVAR